MANNIEMYHYGVKGMHWGIRRKKSQNHPDEKEKKKKKKKKKREEEIDLSTISDEDLRKIINRLQMERQYKKLKSEEVSAGREYAEKMFKVGKTVAAVTGTGLAIYTNVKRINDIVGAIGV